MARSGSFGASLTPFGGGTLNIDAAYQIGGVTPTPSPPQPAPPPPIDYGGLPQQAVPESPVVPIVGTTPIPPGIVKQPTPLQQWAPTPPPPTFGADPRGQYAYSQTPAAPAPAPAPRVTTGDAYNAIRARYPNLTFAQVQAQYQRDLARGMTNADIAGK